jgi:hypothetical protein
MKKIVANVLLIALPIHIYAAEIIWNLNTTYGVTQSGLSRTVADAKAHFFTNPDDKIIVTINAGTYSIGGNGKDGIAFKQGFQPGSNGRLIFKGAGMNLTKLLFKDTRQDMIHGKNVYRITFQDMHMARVGYTVTQGLVVAVSLGEIDIAIQDGFPTPLELFDETNNQGRFFRRYTNSTDDPLVIQENNKQVPWGYRDKKPCLPKHLNGNIWRFYLNNKTLLLSNYKVGDLVGMKSKHEGETYWFYGGGDVVFENIKWTGSSRGLVRNGFSNLTLRGCRIERGAPINGQMPCLSTPSGGPQMNQPAYPTSSNMIVENCFIDSPGDDCVAFFNVDGGKVINCALRNSFARGILITNKAKNICLENNNVENNPVLIENGKTIDEITNCSVSKKK